LLRFAKRGLASLLTAFANFISYEFVLFLS
jgi:hypothetical protein